MALRALLVASPSVDPVSSISQAYPDRVEVRGRDLTSELMSKLSFTEYFYLLLTGREATEEQRFFLDLLLVAIAEHGMMPTNVAARMTLAAEPRALQGAVAAGILGAGPVLLGTSEACAELLSETQEKVDAGASPTDAAKERVAQANETKERLPGFGHPVHTPTDPRAMRIFELAEEHGVAGRYVELGKAFGEAVNEGREKPLTLNISMPMAAVMLDLGFSADTVKAVPLLARTAGLLAHLAEERQNPVGFHMAKAAEDSVRYEPPADEPDSTSD
jgi:citrate synthase